MDGWMGWMGWLDLCVGLFYEHGFAVLIKTRIYGFFIAATYNDKWLRADVVIFLFKNSPH